MATGADHLVQDAIKQRAWRRSGKALIVILILALLSCGIGVPLILTARNGPPPAVPTCNGQPMEVTDICDQYTNGSLTGSYTFSEMQQEEKPSDVSGRIGGGIFLGIAVWMLILGATTYSPMRAWGKKSPVPNCPSCGQPTLREKLMMRSTTIGHKGGRRLVRRERSVITLCTPECGFTAARAPAQRKQ